MRYLIIIGALLSGYVAGLDFGLRGSNVEPSSAFSAEVFVQDVTVMRGVNLECTYDTSKIIIDSVRSELGGNFMFYANDIDSSNNMLHIVLVYRGMGHQSFGGKLCSVFGRSKNVSATASFIFSKNQTALIDSNNNEITVNYKDWNINIGLGSGNSHLKFGKRIQKYQIWPNPFTTSVNIIVNSNTRTQGINIYDIHGKLVRNIARGTDGNGIYVWNPEHLPSGVYVANITDGINLVSRRITFSK